MADTLTLIHTLTGFSDPDLQVVTDGTDLFWQSGDNNGTIYKYDVSENTHALFVDSSNFDIEGGNSFGQTMQLMVFRGNIYAGIRYNSGTYDPNNDPIAKVYKITPAGGVSTVISSFPKTTNVSDNTFGLILFVLHATEDFLVASFIEQRSNGGSSPPEFISQYTTNGTNWSTATNSFSESVAYNGSVQLAFNRDFRSLGIIDSFPIGGFASTDNVILEFNNGAWTKIAGPISASPSGTTFEVGPVHIWTNDDFSEYTNDYINFFTPAAGLAKIVGLNMPFAVSRDSANDDETIKLNTDNPPIGEELDATMATVGFGVGSQVTVMVRLNDGNSLMVAIAFGATFPDWTIWQRDRNLGATPLSWIPVGDATPPDMPRPADINADGTFLYVAAFGPLDKPILVKVPSDLLSNGELVFDPGEGSEIGVICSKNDPDVVWVAGDFDSTNRLEKSTDAGATFIVLDDGTFGAISAFAIGPDSDDRIIMADSTVNLRETIDNGVTWSLINGGVGFSIRAIARYALDVMESVFGNDAGVANNIDYSLDSGATMEDFTTGDFPTISDVKRVIVN